MLKIKKILSLLCAGLLWNCFTDAHDNEVCFVGDSITYLWDLEYYFPEYVIHKHAISGSTISDVDKWDLSDCRGLPLVLLIGTNDIGYVKSTSDMASFYRKKFVAEYMNLATKLSGNPLIAISILPRNEWGKEDPLVNENIKILNSMLQDSLKKLPLKYIYLDVFDDFLYEDFSIRQDLFKDGLHPNEFGYEILTKKIGEQL